MRAVLDVVLVALVLGAAPTVAFIMTILAIRGGKRRL